MPGAQLWPSRLGTSVALVLAAAYVAVFRRLDVPWLWVAIWCGSLASLALLPRWPALGLGVYAAMFYGTPRYTVLFEQLAASRALHVVVVLTAIAALGGVRGSWRHPAFRTPLACVAGLAAAWLCLAAMLPRSSDIPAIEAVRHSPVYLVHAAVLLGAAALVMSRASAVLPFVLPLGSGLAIRALVQGIDGIRLEGDIGPIAVMALPLCLLVARGSSRAFVRLAAVGAAVGAAALVGLTYNRASAVAFGAVMVAIAWGFRRHLWAIAFVVVAAAAGWYWLLNSPLAARFEQVQAELLGERSGSVSERIELWRAGRAMIADHPVFGVGLGRYPSELAAYAPGLEGKVAHNSYVQMAAETGVIGGLLYVALFVGAVAVAARISWRDRGPQGLAAAAVAASLAGYLAASFFISRHDMVLAYILVGWVVAIDVAARRIADGGSAAPTAD